MELFEGFLHLTEIETVAREMKRFRFEKPDGFKHIAGQFLMIKFTETVWRAYSIASAPHESHLELIVRIIPGGIGSTVLDKAKPGDKLFCKGSFGPFVLSKNENSHLVFCGTGTGIAPIRSMILTEAKKETPRPMTLFFGGRNPEDLPYLDEIETWAKNLEIKVGFSRELDPHFQRNFYAENCRITKFLGEVEPTTADEFYICGNGDAVRSIQELLQQKQVERKQIFFERFN